MKDDPVLRDFEKRLDAAMERIPKPCPQVVAKLAKLSEKRLQAMYLDEAGLEVALRREIQRIELERLKRAASPPGTAEFLLILFCKGDQAQSAVGDFNEMFDRDRHAVGLERARRLYWGRTLRSLWPLARRAIARAFRWTAIASAFSRLLG